MKTKKTIKQYLPNEKYKYLWVFQETLNEGGYTLADVMIWTAKQPQMGVIDWAVNQRKMKMEDAIKYVLGEFSWAFIAQLLTSFNKAHKIGSFKNK